MENTLIQFFTTQWPAIAILSIWGYFLVKYFMSQLEKKDSLNQENLKMFMDLVKENITVNVWVNDTLKRIQNILENIHPKLNEMHDDIKSLKK